MISKYFGKDGLVSKVMKWKTGSKIAIVVTTVTGFYQLSSYGYDWTSKHYADLKEKKARRKMIGTDVAHGLAWSHYYGYLQHVLPVLEKKIKDTTWFNQLSTEEKRKMPMKLYELIPRKCFIDIPGTDENIEKISEITMQVFGQGNKRTITVPIYRIKDGEKIYYCICECPYVLKTIHTMHDIQMAGISLPRLQKFNIDTKLVQLMKFYYAMSSLISSNKKEGFGERARLLLFNESEKNLSNVLLEAIKEDLELVDTTKQKSNCSLMEKKLLSAEEIKDIFYDYDVFITHPEDVQDEKALKNISGLLEKKKMKMLTENDCLGKDWREKIKYAATKCRWIVVLDNIGSKYGTLMSSNVIASLKSILESRKVQTVAIVDSKNKQQIHEDLRCVTSISYHNNDEYLINTLYDVVSGLEVKLKTPHDLKPGEVAVGLAWGYAVNYLNKVLPGKMVDSVAMVKKGIDEQLSLKDKLYILIPKKGKTSDQLEGVELYKNTDSVSTEARSYQFSIYKLNNQKKYFVGQYAAPVNAIRKMKEIGLLDEEQMEKELEVFYHTVLNIMRILFPEKEGYYEFIYYDETDKTKKLPVVLSNRVK